MSPTMRKIVPVSSAEGTCRNNRCMAYPIYNAQSKLLLSCIGQAQLREDRGDFDKQSDWKYVVDASAAGRISADSAAYARGTCG